MGTTEIKLVSHDDIDAWVREYGLDGGNVRSATITFRKVDGGVVPVADFVVYERDDNGQIKIGRDESNETFAVMTSEQRELHSFPPIMVVRSPTAEASKVQAD